MWAGDLGYYVVCKLYPAFIDQVFLNTYLMLLDVNEANSGEADISLIRNLKSAIGAKRF